MTRLRQLWPVPAASDSPRHRAVATLLNADLLYGARLAQVESLLDQLAVANLRLDRAAHWADAASRQLGRALHEEGIAKLEEERREDLEELSSGERAWFAFEALSKKAQDHAWAEVSA